MCSWLNDPPKKQVAPYPVRWQDWEFGQESKAISDLEVTCEALHIVLDLLLPIRPPLYREISLKALRCNPAWMLLCLEDPSLVPSYECCQALTEATAPASVAPEDQLTMKRIGFFEGASVLSNIFPEAYATGALVCLGIIHGIGMRALLPALRRAGVTVCECFKMSRGMMVADDWRSYEELNVMVVADAALLRFIGELDQDRPIRSRMR